MTELPDRETLAYRPCAGVLLFNRVGEVFVARRIDTVGTALAQAWQMPQGGIDKGEDPEQAALRELAEETGVSSAEVVGRTADWLPYDFPDEILANASLGKWRGQKQLWFACRFTGSDGEIDLEAHGEPEFDRWRWAPLADLPDLIVPFKKVVYSQVVAELGPVVRRAVAG